MAFFKKKPKVNEENEDKLETNKATYKIVLLEKLGGTVREIKSFDAVRWVDSEDKVVYLKSVDEKLKFFEIFPQQINDFKNYTEKQVNDLIEKLEKQLEKERNNDSEIINDKDIEFQLLKLKAKQRSFNFSPNASYLAFDEKARPTFYFLREGSVFFPFKWDTDTKSIFVPSDNRKKTARILFDNKENKYNIQKLVSGVTILLLVIGFIMSAGGGYFLFKAKQANDESFKAYDTSKIAEAQRACLENVNKASSKIVESAENIEKITDKLQTQITQPQTVINGVIPE